MYHGDDVRSVLATIISHLLTYTSYTHYISIVNFSYTFKLVNVTVRGVLISQEGDLFFALEIFI